VEFLGAFVSTLLSVVAYGIIFLGVYKLYYIAKDIHEIKELMERKLKNPAQVPTAAAPVIAPVLTPELTKGLSEEDAASAYAEQLLRAVSAESPARVSEPHEVR
jgi:hypothetical protein